MLLFRCYVTASALARPAATAVIAVFGFQFWQAQLQPDQSFQIAMVTIEDRTVLVEEARRTRGPQAPSATHLQVRNLAKGAFAMLRCTPNRWARRRCEHCWFARKQLLGRLIDVELSIRGILRGFGLKVGVVTRKGFEGRIWESVTGHITLERIAGAMLSARATLKAEYEKLHKIVLTIVREDAVCRRLMTVPSVGPLVAITYKSAMDDPNRITKSKAAGALFGLTPKKYQSGEKDVTGGITRTGDEMVRGGGRRIGLITALYEPPNVLLARITRFSKLNAGEWTSPSGEVRNGRRLPWRAKSR